MAITREEVERIASLARLSLEGGETAQFQKELSAILDYVRKLSEVNTGDVPPRTRAGAEGEAFRVDAVQAAGAPGEALRIAPRTQGPFIVVPKVI